ASQRCQERQLNNSIDLMTAQPQIGPGGPVVHISTGSQRRRLLWAWVMARTLHIAHSRAYMMLARWTAYAKTNLAKSAYRSLARDFLILPPVAPNRPRIA